MGKSPGLNHNEFLANRQAQGDFILSLWFRLVDGHGNSGVQFRSVRVPGTEMSGYQADIGENYWGCLYDESRRNKVLVKASPEALKALKKNGWNHYVVYAMGDRISLYLNGAASAVYREEGPGIARDGLDRRADPRRRPDGGPVQGPPDPGLALTAQLRSGIVPSRKNREREL